MMSNGDAILSARSVQLCTHERHSKYKFATHYRAKIRENNIIAHTRELRMSLWLILFFSSFHFSSSLVFFSTKVQSVHLTQWLIQNTLHAFVDYASANHHPRYQLDRYSAAMMRAVLCKKTSCSPSPNVVCIHRDSHLPDAPSGTCASLWDRILIFPSGTLL